MAGTFTAQLATRGGRWHLYVALPGTGERWPEHDFGPRTTVPTLAERSRALNALGYTLTDDAEWTWVEDSETPGDPASPVLLIAATRVREAAR
ncbi:DUF6303 family protein [Streptomyces nanhaiensis]|uniref:DUF6303 family protein n=1 Tax=Streptomyces nanhaiensis TaxID=679319 RepID=UPI00399D2AD7